MPGVSDTRHGLATSRATAVTVACKVQATPLKAVIVDDEALARGYLREMLRAHPEIEIAAECANGFEAVKAIAETAPDLVFLDIQMPKLDGFEVLELMDPGPAVVFVTAYDEYAMRAFDAHAVDVMCYSLRRWASLAAKGNPTILHSLFTPADSEETEWSSILDRREIFLAQPMPGSTSDMPTRSSSACAASAGQGSMASGPRSWGNSATTRGRSGPAG